MRDENPICTLGDYSKPSHEGCMNAIEPLIENNVLPLRSDTIWLVQNGCSFHGLRSEDPNQHLKDFLKLVDSLDLDGENRERTRLRRTAKLRNDILMFQQHHGESLSEAWTRFKDSLQKVPHHGINLWLQVQIFYDHVNPVIRRTIDQAAGGKLHNRNAEESWALLEDLALYDNESWNDPRDFAKPVKEITLPQDVPITSDRRLTKLKNQVQCLMEAHLALTQPTQVNKISTSCEICTGPHDTQYCIENPKQAFVNYASLRTDEVGEDAGEVMFIEIIQDDDEPRKEGSDEGERATTKEPEVEYFDTFPTRDEQTYYKYLMSGLIPLIFLKNPIITEGYPSNLKIPCNIGHVHIEKAYIDLNSPLNIMTRMMYNWIMRRKLDPRENSNGGEISSIIDLRLSQVVLGRPFVEISNMSHGSPEGVVRFTNENDEVAKMPHKIEQSNSLLDLEKEHTKSTLGTMKIRKEELTM
nr:MAK10-like protein [Tanacetum cinerariifolium]